MVHYPGFYYKLSKLLGISERYFPVLKNYKGDYEQLVFYSDPSFLFIQTKNKAGIVTVGGITSFTKTKDSILTVMSLNLGALINGSLVIKSKSIWDSDILDKIAKPLKIPRHPFQYIKTELDYNKFIKLFIKFWFHEYLHCIGISERGIRALKKIGVEV